MLACLRDPDVSIRRRSLDLMFNMCNASNAEEIVAELLDSLSTADYSMREEMVLKTAVLAERFMPNLEWYLDSMLILMERAGDFAINDLWQVGNGLQAGFCCVYEVGLRFKPHTPCLSGSCIPTTFAPAPVCRSQLSSS